MANGWQWSDDDLQLFLDELGELLETLERNLLMMEEAMGGEAAASGSPTPSAVPAIPVEILNEMFRAAHTIKGSSGAVGFTAMARLTHALESVLDLLRQGRSLAHAQWLDLLLAALDELRRLRDEYASAVAQGGAEAGVAVELSPGGQEVVRQLQALAQGASGEATWTAWRVEVAIDPACPMPAVRAFQAYQVMAQLGEVLRSTPTLAEIEREAVGDRLQVWFRPAQGAEGTPDTVAQHLSRIPELRVLSLEPAGVPEEPSTSAPTPAPGASEGPQPGPAATQAAAPTEAPATAPAMPAQGLAPERPPLGSAGTATSASAEAAGEQTVRVSVQLLEQLMNLVGELVVARTRLVHLFEQLQAGGGQAADAGRDELVAVAAHMGRVTAELQEHVMRVRMVPVATVFRRLPRLVRDLARQLGKEVRFETEGDEQELDRSLIEHLTDPLVHLLRNAIDHGIEPPEERVRLGKPRQGLIRLQAAHEENRIVLVLSDDGRGIDPQAIREAAVRKGVITPEEAQALDDAAAVDLIFRPGFSTASAVTDISGRGVGMDVVRRNVERVGGLVVVESRPGEGTRFRLEMPLTLAIIRSLLVRSEGLIYAIPLGHVVEAMGIEDGEVRWVQGSPHVLWRGAVLPLVRLPGCGEGRAEQGAASAVARVVVVRHGSQRVGLVVDELIGEQETVIKSLSPLVGEGLFVSGAAILGLGEIALILDVARFLVHIGRNSSYALRQRVDGSRSGLPLTGS